MTSHLLLPGADWLETPDAASLEPGSSVIEYISCIAANSYTISNRPILSKRGSGSTKQFVFLHHLPAAGDFRIGMAYGTTDGATETFVYGSPLDPPDPGSTLWSRIIYTPSTPLIEFFHSFESETTPVGSVTWVTQTTRAEGNSLADTSSPVRIGRATALSDFAGKIFYVRYNIGGTTAALADFRNDTPGWSTPPATDPQGNVWSFNGDAIWVDESGGSLNRTVGSVVTGSLVDSV